MPRRIARVALVACTFLLLAEVAAACGLRHCRCARADAVSWGAASAPAPVPQSFLTDLGERAAEEAIRILLERIRNRRITPEPSGVDARLERIEADVKALRDDVGKLQTAVGGVDARLRALENGGSAPPVSTVKQFDVFVVYESEQVKSAEAKVMDALHTLAEGRRFRYLALDQNVLEKSVNPPADLAAIFKPEPGQPLPRVILRADGVEIFRGPLPATEAEATALVQKYAPVR